MVAAPLRLEEFNDGKTNGRIVFEIGAGLLRHDDVRFRDAMDWHDQSVFDGLELAGRGDEMPFLAMNRPRAMAAVRSCIALHDRFCDKARAAIRCWIWVAQQLKGPKVIKDMRVLVAKKLWSERAAWSEEMAGGTGE